MKAAVKRFHSPDADLESYTPTDAGDVGVLVQIMAGPADRPGEESFDVVVCTPRWLAGRADADGPIIGRHHLVVEAWDWPRIRAFLTDEVETHEAPTWQELAGLIGRVGRWEFEDYRA